LAVGLEARVDAMTFLLRTIGYLFGIGSVFALIGAAAVAWYVSSMSSDLPDYTALRKYEPPVMTRVHAADGSLVAEYAVERRLFLPIQAVPDLIKQAFLSAEDKNFYHHNGIDPTGIVRAIVTNVRNRGSGRRPVGASTITQQVAKNFLLTNDPTVDRKIKEAILSMRMEAAFTKDKILELYLNDIYLGLGAYGVAAASLVYFDKSVHELTVAEAAYIAALPKAPNNYHPFRFPDRAIERRNWVVDRMEEDGVIDKATADAARAEPLRVTPRHTGPHLVATDYFAEEVRRRIYQLYGESGLYGGGMSVRATLDPKLQVLAREKLNAGLMKFDVQRGSWRGPVDRIDLATGDWGIPLSKVLPLIDVPEWRLAVVLSVSDQDAVIGLRPNVEISGAIASERDTGRATLSSLAWKRRMVYRTDPQKLVGRPSGRVPASQFTYAGINKMSQAVSPGDVVYVEKVPGEGEDIWRLRQVPNISGAMVVMDPHTGRVLALAGGFSYGDSEFNRATQAWRQPGSSFKPFVYAAALDNGYTPASVIVDGPISIADGMGRVWSPKNYGGKNAGPSTLRLGIERSRNLMTVRLAKDMGMPLVAEYSKRFGIYDDLLPYLPMALGAGETTVLRLTSAYAIIANGGKKIVPTLIDRIQDRYGNTIYKHDSRICEGCVAETWADQPEPTLIDESDQVLDPMSAYQITSMMEGVVQRGTATVVRQVGKPVAGKTGTTNEEKDAWFVGFTPDLVAGVFIGYDQPQPMGRGATGGVLAAPIFTEFMKEALADKPSVAFRIPEGIKLVPIDRTSGQRVSGSGGNVVIEAFKPGTAPGEGVSIASDFSYTGEGGGGQNRRVSPEAERAVYSGTGGLY
jgi:penicillin-binding protein 1A